MAATWARRPPQFEYPGRWVTLLRPGSVLPRLCIPPGFRGRWGKAWGISGKHVESEQRRGFFGGHGPGFCVREEWSQRGASGDSSGLRVDVMMNSLTMTTPVLDDFARLYEAAELIARHPDYPGKGAVEDLVLREIDDLFRTGQLDSAQRHRLRAALGRPDRPA